MKIVIVSAFRQMSGRINRYFGQVHALQAHVGDDHSVRVVAVEGDSTDETDRELVSMAELWQTPLQLVKHDHGKPWFGSTEAADRLEALTGVMKAGLGAVKKTDDLMLYVESDLIWTPHQVGSIIDIAFEQREDFDIVAPLIYAGEAFYDIWGYVGLDGERFSPFHPYHPDLEVDGVTEVKSVGSCFCMRAAAVIKVGTKFTGKMGLRSFCAAAKRKKLRIGVASQFRIDHP